MDSFILFLLYLSMIQTNNRVFNLQMKQPPEKRTSNSNIYDWLFGVRLKFVQSQEVNQGRIIFQSKQDSFHHFKFGNVPPKLQDPVKSQVDLNKVYDVFREIIYNFRFDQKSNEKTYKQSKQLLKNKYKINDVESSLKKKIKKFEQIYQIDQSQTQEWKKVLNHKNVINHLCQAIKLTFNVLSLNFEKVSVGKYHVKNRQMDKSLKVKLNILVMELIMLLNEIKYIFLPVFEQEPASKLQIEQKKILDEQLSKLQVFKQYKEIKLFYFFQKIKLHTEEIQDPEEKMWYKLWIEIFDVKKRYLIDETGIWKRQRNNKIESTFLEQLKLYWWNISNQIAHKKYDAIQHLKVNFMQIFKQYKKLFNFILNDKSKIEQKDQKINQITKYLDLIQQIWTRIDEESALQLFWSEITKIYSNKINLPAYYLKKSSNTIGKIKKQAIQKYLSIAQEQMKRKFQQQVDSLSQDLIQLQQSDRLYEGYMKKHYERLRKLLKQKYFATNYPKILEEQLAKKSDYYDIQLIRIIKQKCDNLDLETVPTNIKLSQKQQQQTTQQLYTLFPQQPSTVDDIKHFIQIVKCLLFQNKSTLQNLQTCRKYYESIRTKIFNVKDQKNIQQRNRYGIKYTIRILTYQLITCIELQRPEVQSLIKKVFKFISRIYKRKMEQSQQGDYQENQDTHQQADENDELDYEQEKQDDESSQFTNIILNKSSSGDIDQNKFYLEDYTHLENNQKNNYALIYIKKIYELRTQVLANKIKSFRNSQQKFGKTYCELKKKIYQYAARQYLNNQQVLRDINALPEIQFDFQRQSYYDGWKKLRKLNNLTLISSILNKNWSGSHNLAKIFINIYFEYKETSACFSESGELSEYKIKQLISKILPSQQKYMRQRLRDAIKLLDDIQKIQFLRKQKQEQIAQSSQQKRVKCKSTFRALDQKVLIETIYKNDVRIFKNYTISKIPQTSYNKIYERVRKLSLLNRRIFVQGDKIKGSISIKIDQLQNSFETFPLAVRRLIKQYVQIIKFCKNQLKLDFYPLIWQNNLKIERSKENKIYYELNPYEGILLNILLSYQQIKQLQYYKYPQFPFIELADELKSKFQINKIYQDKKYSAEYYAFYHLLEEMKAISMEPENNSFQITANNILKCPYFWSTSQKLFEIVQFKQIYQTGINVQQGRRKENEKRRSQLDTEEKYYFSTLVPEKQRNKQYKTAYGYHKTTQIYFSIEGVLEKQAFLQDIGNFKQDNNMSMQEEERRYKYHTYWWSKQKHLIIKLIDIVAERERKKGSQKSTLHQKTFNSFQNHIRNLRNLAVHYIYDGQEKKQYDTQQKISIFQDNFPKIFIFLYRWRGYIGKDFTNVIKPQKINLLKELFVNESNPDMIQKLESIKELSKYNIKNTNKALFKRFSFDYDKVSGCKPCGILCASMKKQNSFWSFLEDIQIQKQQKTKPQHDSRYNVLFFDHQKQGCNGLEYLMTAFINSTSRNKFTSEEIPFITEEQYDKNRNDEDSPKKNSKQRLMKELIATDYVCKYFIFQLEMQFPYIFYDLRKERYQWDPRATEYPQKRQ